MLVVSVAMASRFLYLNDQSEDISNVDNRGIVLSSVALSAF